jgi:hypothetical protein
LSDIKGRKVTLPVLDQIKEMSARDEASPTRERPTKIEAQTRSILVSRIKDKVLKQIAET